MAAVAGFILATAAILPGGSALQALAGLMLSVFPLAIIVTLVGNSLTYAILHDDRIDVCELTRKAKRSIRYHQIESVEIVGRQVAITYKPHLWGDRYSPYLQSVKIWPRDTAATVAELRWRVEASKSLLEQA
jgi:hypothetical protein